MRFQRLLDPLLNRKKQSADILPCNQFTRRFLQNTIQMDRWLTNGQQMGKHLRRRGPKFGRPAILGIRLLQGIKSSQLRGAAPRAVQLPFVIGCMLTADPLTADK